MGERYTGTIRPAPLESSIVKSSLDWLNKQPDCMGEKNHGSVYSGKGRSDTNIMVCGLFVKIEFKRPGECLKKLQQVHLIEWAKKGAIVDVAYSKEDVVELVERIRKAAITETETLNLVTLNNLWFEQYQKIRSLKTKG